MAETATKSKSETKKEVQSAKGLCEVEFLEDLGNSEKGETKEMQLSTAKALVAHGKVKIIKKVTTKKPVKEE